jgi:SpoVK/Ycf46/Vps4 family AAA+-type ATPase
MASDLVSERKLPKRGDGVITHLVKFLSILDSANKYLNNEDEDYDKLESFIEEEGAEEMVNAHFVQMFFSTELNKKLDSEHMHLGLFESLLIARHQDLGTLYIRLYMGEPHKKFWHSPGFDFDGLLTILWGMYDGRIHIEMGSHHESGVVYTTIPEHTDPLLGSANQKLDRTVKRHNAYIADGLSRTYMFLGIQGTGKSTFALHWAKETEQRGLLRIDANGMTGMSASDMRLILTSLKPDFVIVDDVDRAAGMERCLATMLGMMLDLKQMDFPVTMILTVNDESMFTRAFVRPGRVDEVIEFGLLEVTVRKALIAGYLPEFKVELSDEQLTELATAAEGLTGAYLKELALRCRYWEFDEVLESVEPMREIAGSDDDEDDPDEDDDLFDDLEEAVPYARARRVVE